MPMPLPLSLPLLLASAVSVSPASVPANGRQTAIVTVDRPSMVHLTARSAAGTACEVVDKVRGPFAHDGTPGRRNCAVDLLLDSGTYKLRLDSAHRGKGAAQLSAAAFTDINAAPVRLLPRALVRATLKAGQQASYWLRLDARAVPMLRVSGRTAGDVKLWRSGDWVEEVPLDHQQYSPEPGRPVHEWWVNSTLEAGDYLVTVYGTGLNEWPGGNENDALELEYGFREGPAERATSFVLGPSGVLAVMTQPAGDLAALLSLDGTQTNPTTLQMALNGYTPQASCTIEKKALLPQCSTWTAQGPPASRVLLVRGPAGTRGTLEWLPQGSRESRGGFYGAAATRVDLFPKAGAQLVTVHDLPADLDAAPLGCFLTHKEQVVAADFPTIDRDQKLDAQFNYDSSGGQVWFKLVRGGKYRIDTTGDRKSHCELFSLQSNGQLTRVSQSQPKATSCQLGLSLQPGLYQLGLYEGLSGVEHLTVQEDGATGARTIASKSSCLLPEVTLDGRLDYELQLNRTGAVTSRGVLTAALPLSLDTPLHLTLDPGAKLLLPLAANVTAQVRSAGSAPFGCGVGVATLRRDGQCALSASSSSGVLTLENSGPTTVGVTAFRSGALPGSAALASYSPTPRPLPVAKADAPEYFDFQRQQSHSLVFDVAQAGLYHVTTLGLLGTSCALRTPVITTVATDTGSGRGKNCLVSGYLRPGRYMVTVTAQGQSQGRAGVVLTRRALKEQAALAAEGDAFFRVEANDLVQQRLSLKRAGRFELATTAQGASGALACRLDDSDGWPVLEVPTRCTLTRPFAAGTYLWTQLPLTVESMRHSSLKVEKTPAVLKGNRPHPVEFFTWYQASLGRDGKDEFTFKLEGPTTLDVVLTKGMQGRLYLLEPDKQPKAIELIPPTESREAPEGNGLIEGEGEGEATPVEQSEGESDGSEGGDEGGRAVDDEPQTPPPRAVEPVQAEQAPPPPSGHQVALEAGAYRLVTEHSRGDVAVDYQLHLGSAVLMPGMTRLLPTPSRLAVKVPRDGTLRLRTRGDADVRCRFFDATGKLVFEGSENGPDWNCALAEPVLKGDYTLVLESETQSRAQSELSISLAPIEDQGPVVDAATLKLGAAVQVLSVPLAEKDAVQEVSFKSKSTFSCALEAPDGRIATRRTHVTDCSLLVRPQTDRYRVRLWTTDGSAQLSAGYRSRLVSAFDRQVPAGGATLATLKSAGLYRTAAGAFCLPAGERGLLKRCGPEVSLEAGPTLFATFGDKALAVPLDELTAPGGTSGAALSRRPWLQGVTASAPSVFLLEASVQHGERAAPSCAFDGPGTVREGRDAECFAATGVATRAIERLWAPVDDELPVAAATRVRTVAVPAKAEVLTPGRKRLRWAGEAGLYQLPAGVRARVELTLPADGWAVLLDEAGGAADLCAPTGALSRCTLTGTGARLLLAGPADPQADATTVVLDAPERTVRFTGLYEDLPRTPGALKLQVAAAEGLRAVTIEGARRCTVALGDGVRISGCRAQIPPRVSAELLIEHGVDALRAMVHRPGAEKSARLGLELPLVAGPTLPAATAIPLVSARTDRTLVLDRDAVVRITADAGVCGLFRGNDLLAVDGLAAGCELVRVLPPGTYRVLARPFASAATPGTLQWTAEPVSTLADGIGPEEWLAPGDVRLYRFATGSKGHVGLGIQAGAESLDCAVYDDSHRPLGEGCQQYLTLDQGAYLLTVRLPAVAGAQPLRFKPVLLGLAGAKSSVPRDYLEDFFRRTGATP